MAKDVIAGLDTKKLNRVVLVGHDFAGSELSASGTLYPQGIRGLVYLHATGSFAHYTEDGGEHAEIFLMQELKKSFGAPSAVRSELVTKMLPQYINKLQQEALAQDMN